MARRMIRVELAQNDVSASSSSGRGTAPCRWQRFSTVFHAAAGRPRGNVRIAGATGWKC
jgi:hypothetical protein